jgi:hypothetical protein
MEDERYLTKYGKQNLQEDTNTSWKRVLITCSEDKGPERNEAKIQTKNSKRWRALYNVSMPLG